jgi:hypothetical protein
MLSATNQPFILSVVMLSVIILRVTALLCRLQAGSKITWVSLGAHQEGLHSGLDIKMIFVKRKTYLVLIKGNAQTFLSMNHP